MKIPALGLTIAASPFIAAITATGSWPLVSQSLRAALASWGVTL